MNEMSNTITKVPAEGNGTMTGWVELQKRSKSDLEKGQECRERQALNHNSSDPEESKNLFSGIRAAFDDIHAGNLSHDG